MRVLGYQRYGAAGNDWGSYIAPEIGRTAPSAVIGAHVTQLLSLPDGESLGYPPTCDAADLARWPPQDQASLQELRFFQRHLGAFYHLHAQQPQTLAYALTDSPAGLLAWASQVMDDLDTETLLTHVSIHWLTGTAGSALRIYAEHERQPPAAGPTTVPLALAQFQGDAHAVRGLPDSTTKVTSRTSTARSRKADHRIRLPPTSREKIAPCQSPPAGGPVRPRGASVVLGLHRNQYHQTRLGRRALAAHRNGKARGAQPALDRKDCSAD